MAATLQSSIASGGRECFGRRPVVGPQGGGLPSVRGARHPPGSRPARTHATAGDHRPPQEYPLAANTCSTPSQGSSLAAMRRDRSAPTPAQPPADLLLVSLHRQSFRFAREAMRDARLGRKTFFALWGRKLMHLPTILRRALPRTRGAGRPAARRVARATSSSDSGEPGEPPLARLRRALRRARGLAECPVCCNEATVRSRCWFCRGLGYVGREQRNRYKRGEQQ